MRLIFGLEASGVSGFLWGMRPALQAATALQVWALSIGTALLAGARLDLAAQVGSDFSIAPGLSVSFQSDSEPERPERDVTVRPSLALYVPAGSAPSPFVEGGRFRAVWEGWVTVDLRRDYTFQLEFSGAIRFEVNERLLVETNGLWDAGNALLTQPIRLSKGTNVLRLVQVAPERGPIFLRVTWAQRGGLPRPIPESALWHDPARSGLQRAAQLRSGRELLIEHRCLKCHGTTAATASAPWLDLDAPSFEGIGSRRQAEWIERYVLDPRASRSGARMPQALRGPAAAADARAVAAYLASLQSPSPASAQVKTGDPAIGKDLAGKLHCTACHVEGPIPPAGEPDAWKISLAAAAAGFTAGALDNYLRKPDTHFRWTRMPDFQLTEAEAAHVAAYLHTLAQPAPPDPDRYGGPDLIAAGERIVRARGCRNCHAGGPSELRAPEFDALQPDRLAHGCLADRADAAGSAPTFGFDAEQMRALREFLRTERRALDREAPVEFAARHLTGLRCGSCHGSLELVPTLPMLAGRLQPDWARRLLAGQIAYKPRPWLPARMPAFRPWAAGLAEGLAMMHGFAPQPPPDTTVDAELAKIGSQLVAADGGFSCVSCHAIGSAGATQVFESHGINLAYTGERLLKSYFQRWVINPLEVDPTTKMPVYFDETGRSALTGVLEGDGFKQIEALWHYVRLGARMPAPPDQR